MQGGSAAAPTPSGPSGGTGTGASATPSKVKGKGKMVSSSSGLKRKDAFFEDDSDDEDEAPAPPPQDDGEDDEAEQGAAGTFPPAYDEGRFASQAGGVDESGATGNDLLERALEQAQAGKKTRRGGRGGASKRGQDDTSAGDALQGDARRRQQGKKAATTVAPDVSAERPAYIPPQDREAAKTAAAERRERHKALWSKTSRSAQGKERGQPSLNARMKVMLDRVKRQQAA